MKKILFTIITLIMISGSNSLLAQKSSGNWSVGADILNRWNWRGIDFGNSPVVQPVIEYAYKGFAIGAWGNYSLSTTNTTEADLYASYNFDFGLRLDFTDFYSPIEPGNIGNYFAYDTAHIFEIGGIQTIGNLNLSAYYFLNVDDDLYFEVSYDFDDVNVFLGAGNNYFTTDGNFMITNLGISLTKEIKMTEKFSLPLIGKVIFNPDTEQVYIIFGITLSSD